MTPKQAIDKVKQLLKQTFGEQSFDSATLKDGSKVEYSTLEPGGNIFVVDADGNQQPAAVGNYELEDGTVIVVTEPGVIAEVVAASEAPAEEQEMEDAPSAPADITSLQDAITALDARVTALEKKAEDFRTQTANTMFSMLSAVEAMAACGDGETIQKPKQTLFADQSDKKASALAKLKAGAEAYKKSLLAK
ncbi:hypothetical protein [Chitinophaga sp. HK235]|uniref:hypothetical protein n=1 Tax=Chitinophaga sp. HK235 TaxID=2952571 RepID=UPI001BA9D8CD|nr:hypothetical protein [Chitinophaga sp. HK235]